MEYSALRTIAETEKKKKLEEEYVDFNEVVVEMAKKYSYVKKHVVDVVKKWYQDGCHAPIDNGTNRMCKITKEGLFSNNYNYYDRLVWLSIRIDKNLPETCSPKFICADYSEDSDVLFFNSKQQLDVFLKEFNKFFINENISFYYVADQNAGNIFTSKTHGSLYYKATLGCLL